jgi:hypothetical protein
MQLPRVSYPAFFFLILNRAARLIKSSKVAASCSLSPAPDLLPCVPAFFVLILYRAARLIKSSYLAASWSLNPAQTCLDPAPTAPY